MTVGRLSRDVGGERMLNSFVGALVLVLDVKVEALDVVEVVERFERVGVFEVVSWISAVWCGAGVPIGTVMIWHGILDLGCANQPDARAVRGGNLTRGLLRRVRFIML